jgi:hypothetical protein
MTDRTSFYPELEKKIAPATGRLAVLCRARRRFDHADRRRAPDPKGRRRVRSAP